MRPIHLILAFLVAVVLLVLCVRCDGTRIQAACVSEAEDRLVEAGVDSWASVKGDGRGIAVLGEAPDDASRQRALTAVSESADCVDPDQVADEMTVTPAISPYITRIDKAVDGKVTLSGHAPDLDSENWLIDETGNVFGTDNTTETVEVAPGATASWQPSMAAALAQIGSYDEAVATLTDTTLTVEGRASSAALRDSIETNIRTTLPQNITASFAVDAPEPVQAVTNYKTVYDFDGTRVTLDGYSPDEDSRGWLVGEAQGHVGQDKVTDDLEIASGAPEGWRSAMSAVTAHVRNYDSATATLRDQTLEIEGTANSTPMRDLTQSTITGRLPTGFGASFNVNTPDEAAKTVTLSSKDVSCQVELNQMLSGEVVLFDFDRFNVKPEAEALLKNVAGVLGTCPEAAIDIVGRTDPKGSAEYNQRLSQKRADAVATYLQTAGVDTVRMKPVGYGETVPVTQDEQGMAQARRVEFVVTKR